MRFHGSENVLGLRSTRSYDFEVPEQFLHADFFQKHRRSARSQWRPFYGWSIWRGPALRRRLCARPARRTLDEWLNLARGKTREDGRPATAMQTF